MDDMWVSAWRGLRAVFSDPSFLQVVTAAASLLIMALFKAVRGFIMRLCRAFIRGFGSKKHHLNSTYTKKYDTIGADLLELRLKLDADRIAIYQFHNGDEFTLSNPIFKVTCSYERVRNGLSFNADVVKLMLVSNFIDLVGSLLNPHKQTAGVEELGACQKIEDNRSCSVIGLPLRVLKFQIDEMPYSQFKYVMERLGVTTMYATLLYAKDINHPIGIFCIQYQDGENHDAFIDSHICTLCDTVLRVQFLLDSTR